MLERLLDDEPVIMGGLFFGLVVGTIWIAWQLLTRVDLTTVSIVAGVAVALFLLLGLRSDTSRRRAPQRSSPGR